MAYKIDLGTLPPTVSVKDIHSSINSIGIPETIRKYSGVKIEKIHTSDNIEAKNQ